MKVIWNGILEARAMPTLPYQGFHQSCEICKLEFIDTRMTAG